MPNLYRQFAKVIPTVPDLPGQVRIILSELSAELHSLTTETGPRDRLIHSDLIHSFTPKELISWVGQPEPEHPLPDTITVEVSHAF